MSFLTAILFEVMDKEWPLWFVLVVFVGLGLGGMVACTKRPSMVVVFLALVLGGGIRQVMELNDPYIGPAIRSEAGLGYVILSYVSIGAGIFLPLTGAWQGRVRRKNRSNSTSF